MKNWTDQDTYGFSYGLKKKKKENRWFGFWFCFWFYKYPNRTPNRSLNITFSSISPYLLVLIASEDDQLDLFPLPGSCLGPILTTGMRLPIPLPSPRKRENQWRGQRWNWIINHVRTLIVPNNLVIGCGPKTVYQDNTFPTRKPVSPMERHPNYNKQVHNKKLYRVPNVMIRLENR